MASRPDWDAYFFGIAFMVAQRSLDPHTKHGTLLLDRNNHIIATGYNSFPRDMNDDLLPTNRPYPEKPDELNKYDFMEGCHSERNALANCVMSPWLIQGGAIAYITGMPCNSCLMALWQSNVTEVKYAKRKGTSLESERSDRVREHFLNQIRMDFTEYDIDLTWTLDATCEIRNFGFLKTEFESRTYRST